MKRIAKKREVVKSDRIEVDAYNIPKIKAILSCHSRSKVKQILDQLEQISRTLDFNELKQALDS